MKRTTLTPLAQILAADVQLASWNARREREAKLTALVRHTLPRPVAERVFVAHGDGPTLTIAASSGAIASVVRQQGPQILALLAREGWQFSGIRLRVQPQQRPPESPKNVPRQWDSANRRPLVALERRLPPGPLKAALGKFLKAR